MLYIDQLHIPSFPIPLVKTESGFIVRSVETARGRWKLMAAVISADAYPFLAFSELTCHLEDMEIGVFWLHCAADIKETELGSSNQEASPSAGKNTGVVLVPCSRMEVHPYSYFWWYGCHLLRQMSSQWGSQKLLQGLVSHELTAYLSIF